MRTSNQFSFQRFLLLGKQSFLINKKLIGMSLVGLTFKFVILLYVFQHMKNFVKWNNMDYMIWLVALFLINGLLYVGESFPAFRSKEKTMAYLMLPATNTEKFMFELLSKVVLFLFLMPAYFWLIANLEGMIVHSFVPEFINYKFSFSEAYSELVNKSRLTCWGELFVFQGILFLLIGPFTGAIHFSKAPLVKTLFVFILIVVGYSLISYFLINGFKLYEFHPESNSILFIGTKNGTLATFAIVSVLINLCLVAIAWFGFKEKEV